MNKLAALILALATSASGQTPIIDGPGQIPKHIVLFRGSAEIQQLHQDLVKLLPTTKFTVVVPPGMVPASGTNVTSVDVQYPVTNWAQDRLVRFYKNGPVISAAWSDHLVDSNVSPYELAVPLALSSISTVPPTVNFRAISRPGPRETHVRPVSASTQSWIPGVQSTEVFGDGGDRIVTKQHIFIGASTANLFESVSKIEQVFGKKAVLLDSQHSYSRYVFHIDMFLTQAKDFVILGSITEALRRWPDAKWMDVQRMKRLVEREQLVKAQLKAANVEFKVIPMFYADAGLVTLNNGIWSDDTFITADFDLDGDAAEALTQMKAELQKLIPKVSYLAGGEKLLKLGGLVRCSTAVIEQNIKE